jgi:carbamoyltransferase
VEYLLGISGLYHDSAAALLRDGQIVAAAQEERFTRIKHDAAFPEHAVSWCLQEAGTTLSEVAHVVFYDKPLLKFERLLETYLAVAPRGFASFRKAMPIWLREKLFLKDLLVRELRAIDRGFHDEKLLFSEHHFSHAASAFYPSPFQEAVVLTLDGVGEWASSTVALGKGADLDIVKEMHFPHSLGLLYSAFTYYTGFRVNSGEYKVMGLAPYGEPRFNDLILEHIVDLKEDGSFRLDQDYFNYASGLTMTSHRFSELFGKPVRSPDRDRLTDFHMDVAASIQAVTEEVVLRLTRALAREYGMSNLCLAGGVALNCVANGRILRDGAFEGIWIQPAAGDAGGALGAALGAWHREFGKPRSAPGHDAMRGAYIGPRFDDAQIEQALSAAGAVFERLDDDAIIDATARSLAAGNAVGWFQGRMEFGPRALGGRSILGDPRSPAMQKTLNLKVKYRESFRPFAPSVLREDVADWFELDCDSPYMLLVADVHPSLRREMTQQERQLFGIDKLNVKRSEIPAVSRPDREVQGTHRLSGAGQHLLQRARRAHRMHPGGCLSLLHGHGAGRAGGRELPPAQVGPGRVAARGLPQPLRPRLRLRDGSAPCARGGLPDKSTGCRNHEIKRCRNTTQPIDSNTGSAILEPGSDSGAPCLAPLGSCTQHRHHHGPRGSCALRRRPPGRVVAAHGIRPGPTAQPGQRRAPFPPARRRCAPRSWRLRRADAGTARRPRRGAPRPAPLADARLIRPRPPPPAARRRRPPEGAAAGRAGSRCSAPVRCGRPARFVPRSDWAWDWATAAPRPRRSRRR